MPVSQKLHKACCMSLLEQNKTKAKKIQSNGNNVFYKHNLNDKYYIFFVAFPMYKYVEASFQSHLQQRTWSS